MKRLNYIDQFLMNQFTKSFLLKRHKRAAFWCWCVDRRIERYCGKEKDFKESWIKYVWDMTAFCGNTPAQRKIAMTMEKIVKEL